MKEQFNNAVGPQIKHKPQTGNRLQRLVIFLVIILAGLQASTQYAAYQFDYHHALGINLYHIYPLYSVFIWSLKWPEYQAAMMQAGSVGVIVGAIGLLGYGIRLALIANAAKVNPYLHGSARWANMEDIGAAGLLSDDGVYVGAYRDKKRVLHYLRHSGPEHILTYAPTRSGKGVGLVVPTLLSWRHSAVITDLKGELWALTAGWRKHHANNVVIRFEPALLSGSACWNPFDEIRLGTEYEVSDVQNFATLVVDPDGHGLKDHWQKTAQALLTGLFLHLLIKCKNEGGQATMAAVDSMLADPSRNISELWVEMASYSHRNGQPHPVVANAARDMLDRPDEEAGSVLSTAKSYLSLYRDPIVAKNTSRSDFRISDLMNHDKPVSLYIITQPNDKTRLRPLVRVMINMIVRLLAAKIEFETKSTPQSFWQRWLGKPPATYVVQKKTYKHRLLCMMDEFPSLGRLEILQESLAFLAGYGIKFYLICQDINQLKSRDTGYGQDEAITSNCHIQNAFPPNRIETAEHLSRLTGTTTVVKEQITTSGRRTSAILSQVSRTSQEVQRPLLTADECLRMPGPRKNSDGLIEQPGDMVIYAAGFPAIYGEQPLYFHDPVFVARASVSAPKSTDVLITTKQSEAPRVCLDKA